MLKQISVNNVFEGIKEILMYFYIYFNKGK